MRALRIVALVGVPGALIFAAACGSKANAVTKGGECELTADCADGLVCIPQKSGSRICSDDLSGVQQAAPTPGKDAGRPAVDASGADDASAPVPTPDADQPDVTPAPVPDAATE